MPRTLNHSNNGVEYFGVTRIAGRYRSLMKQNRDIHLGEDISLGCFSYLALFFSQLRWLQFRSGQGHMGETNFSSGLGLRGELRHHLQIVYLQDVLLVGQKDENCLGLSLVGQCYSIHLTAQT
ncbi:hypothetical protein AVEN_205099-1 [Araneus ventricosus]|uniref:Uncharacterized protein n=1 Tax=Araneus ventricosus TaxID=182803 RepID=A0A4Y2N2L4_ARAVE|nr:hypothetical protein AVEN_205099-1 [Araneus ventricosus]